jgi:phage portal protein BeeE
MKVQPLSPRLGDPSSLLEAAATRDDIANAFGIPLAFLTKETNLANLRAAERQHLAKSIRPRLRRRDEKLNEQLLPRFDKSQKLFLATPDPLIVE